MTSNSYGSSEVDNDGYDAASQEADIIHDGSRRRPSSRRATARRASARPRRRRRCPASRSVPRRSSVAPAGTRSTRIGQVPDNDVMVFSDRGPGATGATGVDVVADGAYSAGDKTLNTALDGRVAWETWGGTSRSTPVDRGRDRARLSGLPQDAPGGDVPPNFFTKAKDILKSSPQDLGYDSFIQGAGSVDAGRAVQAAARLRSRRCRPDEWRVGDYRGDRVPGLHPRDRPGRPATPRRSRSTVAARGTVSDRSMKRTATERFGVTSSTVGNESASTTSTLPTTWSTSAIGSPHHPDADLMVVRAIFPRSEFDPNGDYARRPGVAPAHLQLDRRQPRRPPVDRPRPRRRRRPRQPRDDPEHRRQPRSTSPHSEMDKGEYVRFMYHRPGANDAHVLRARSDARGWTTASSSACSTRRRARPSRSRTSRSRSTGTRTPTGRG